ncbi:helix-turn-helix domain-containing protein [Nocardioides sp. SYSU D00038]|uniref:helix-turn-helix domain-containing protein n=1 Tax=Nocardioides sp. SYSU D00038 TaxID=2812554 RepID=UPI001967B9A6|nr:helix-turn-helix domain-containing protein [Nocardioides sp. SYSU D00038]
MPDAGWTPDHVDLRILGHLAEGRTVEYVARALGVSERTVRRRLRGTCDAIGVDSTIEAVVHAVRRGYI